MRKTLWAWLVLWVCAPVQLWGQLPSRRFLQVVPHIVAGDGFVTRVSVLNLSTQLNPVDIDIFGQTGQLVRASGDFVSPGGRIDLATGEAQRFSMPTIEWAAVGSDFPVGVNVFFELKGPQPDPITAVGFNGQTPAQRLTFPVGFDPARPNPVDIGIALANVSTNASTIQMQLRDLDGVLRAEKTLQLRPLAQTAFVLSATPPFDAVVRGATPPFLGTLGIIASEPVASIGVGVDFGPFFAVPPFPGAFPFDSSGACSFVTYVPHIVNGSGFQTALTLVNLSVSNNPVEIDFFDQAGAPAPSLPDLAGPLVLGSGAVRFFITGETARFEPVQIRWARIRSSFPLGVNVLFDLKHVAGGEVVTAVGFNASDPQTQIVMPVQLAPPPLFRPEPLNLGVALANVSNQLNSVTVKLGSPAVAQSSLELPPNGQKTFLVSQLPEIAAFLQRQPSFVGSVTIEATQPVVGLGVGDDFGPFFAIPPLSPSNPPVLGGIQVAIIPSCAAVPPGASQAFTASVTGTTNTGVIWSVNDIAGGNSTLGTITASGLYTAPVIAPSPNVVTIKATSAADPTRFAAVKVAIAAGGGGGGIFILTITVAGTGNGAVAANPPGLIYGAGTVVTLTATADAISTFSGWAGACAGMGVCVVTMDANKAVTATFTLIGGGGGGGALPLQIVPFPLQPPLGNGCVDNTGSFVFAQTLIAVGGSPLSGYTWTLSNLSTFPPGTTVEPLTGIFKWNGGTLLPGNYTFSMTVSDGSTTAQGNFNYRVDDQRGGGICGVPVIPPPFSQPFGIANIGLPDALTGHSYGAALWVQVGWSGSAGGGLNLPLSWTLVQIGSLPPGLVLDMARGVVRGVPFSSAAGQTFRFQVVVRNAAGQVAACPATGCPTYIINVPR